MAARELGKKDEDLNLIVCHLGGGVTMGAHRRGRVVDGPLALDIAFSKESAEIKGVKFQVAGDADILIFPNIEAGNIFFKTCAYLAGGEVAAIVTGANCPAILTSRSDSEDSKFFSIALGTLMA